MSLQTARKWTRTIGGFVLGAVVLAAAPWPLLNRVMDRFSSGLDQPASAAKK
jgi:hypothetical protein